MKLILSDKAGMGWHQQAQLPILQLQPKNKLFVVTTSFRHSCLSSDYHHTFDRSICLTSKYWAFGPPVAPIKL